MKQRIAALLIFLSLLLAACAQATPATPLDLPPISGDPLTGTGETQRNLLTLAELTTHRSDLPAPVDDSAFALPSEASPPAHHFEGTLHLGDTMKGAFSKAVKDDFGIARGWRNNTVTLPEFDFEFVQHGSYLIPARQGLIYTGHSFFNMIVGPGRTWKEKGDGDFDRATFPFTLVQRNANCTFNGMMAFLYDDRQVSQVYYQVTQETCPYFKIDLWGQLAAEYRPHGLSGSAELVRQHAEEIANALPVKPISALVTDYPQAGIDPANFIKDYDARHLTTWGVVVNGVHYSAGCDTRSGSSPYCGEMRMASYSTAKSALAGLALMRLGQTYGDKVYSLLIKDYVNETNGSPGKFDTVTVNHALDMRTGNFRTEDDEGTYYMDAFLQTEDFNGRLKAALNFPNSAEPGETFVYKTSDTFLAMLTLDRYLKQQEGKQADIFNLMRDEVYKPIHLKAGMMSALRSDNSDNGVPLGGLGLFWSAEDAAKVMIFLNNQHGAVGGQPVLDPVKLGESLHRKANGAPDPNNEHQYKNGFWVRDFKPEEEPAAQCSFWVPHMSGFGGITLAMLPNGTSLYIFSDNHEDPWESAVWELDKINPVCQ